MCIRDSIKDYAIRDRFEFVGRILDSEDEISKLYQGKSIKKYLRATGSPCHYSYNKKGEIFSFDKNMTITNP